MEQLRLAAASLALAIPAALFALNAYISYQERGIVEPLDIPAAVAFFVLAVLVWRASRMVLFAAAALTLVYLVTALAGGIMQFVAYWILALVLVLQAVPLTGESRARSTV